VDVVGVDLHEAMTVRPDAVLREHRRQQLVALVDQVVAEHDREGRVADVVTGAQHGVAEALRLALAHEVDVGELGRALDAARACRAHPW
jgi:hypothetical protein